MDWLIFALAGTAFFSAAGVLDKLLLSSYARDSKAYIICQVIVQQLFTLPILMKVGIDFVYPQSAIAMAVGALQFLPSIFFMRAVQTEEASRVAAMEYFYPVFVFLGAFLFLGESLAPEKLRGWISPSSWRSPDIFQAKGCRKFSCFGAVSCHKTFYLLLDLYSHLLSRLEMPVDLGGRVASLCLDVPGHTCDCSAHAYEYLRARGGNWIFQKRNASHQCTSL